MDRLLQAFHLLHNLSEQLHLHFLVLSWPPSSSQPLQFLFPLHVCEGTHLLHRFRVPAYLNRLLLLPDGLLGLLESFLHFLLLSLFLFALQPLGLFLLLPLPLLFIPNLLNFLEPFLRLLQGPFFLPLALLFEGLGQRFAPLLVLPDHLLYLPFIDFLRLHCRSGLTFPFLPLSLYFLFVVQLLVHFFQLGQPLPLLLHFLLNHFPRQF